METNLNHINLAKSLTVNDLDCPRHA